MKKCDWCLKSEIYEKYHDEEWGVPFCNDTKYFEFLILESAQAGLNWLTILKKRENYRVAYSYFDVSLVANYDEKKRGELIQNVGIIRNKRKIISSIENAKQFIKIQKEFGSFHNYIWKFVDYHPIVNAFKSVENLPSKTKLSEKISKDLKKRGFSFVGPTIIYAFMQAIGIVNDHLITCPRYNEIIKSYSKIRSLYL